MASRAVTRDISVNLRGPEKLTVCAEEEVCITEKGRMGYREGSLVKSICCSSSTYMTAHNHHDSTQGL